MSETFWYFGASWCSPCKRVRSTDEYKQAKTDLDFVNVDIDEKQELAKEYNIQSIPTLIVERDGEVVDRVVQSSTVQERLAREVRNDD